MENLYNLVSKTTTSESTTSETTTSEVTSEPEPSISVFQPLKTKPLFLGIDNSTLFPV